MSKHTSNEISNRSLSAAKEYIQCICVWLFHTHPIHKHYAFAYTSLTRAYETHMPTHPNISSKWTNVHLLFFARNIHSCRSKISGCSWSETSDARRALLSYGARISISHMSIVRCERYARHWEYIHEESTTLARTHSRTAIYLFITYATHTFTPSRSSYSSSSSAYEKTSFVWNTLFSLPKVPSERIYYKRPPFKIPRLSVWQDFCVCCMCISANHFGCRWIYQGGKFIPQIFRWNQAHWSPINIIKYKCIRSFR